MSLYLQVGAIFGILGGCRREELTNVKVNDIRLYYAAEDTYGHHPMIMVHIPKTKNGEARSFTVKGEFYEIYKRYASLRPEAVDHGRFFVNYQGGKCTKQPIGLNKFGSMPSQVATFLGLHNPKAYTGHCFRRTSATLLVEGGADMEMLKRHGGWKSNAVAAGYVKSSEKSKGQICDAITSSIHLPGTSSKGDSANSSIHLPGPSSKGDSANSSIALPGPSANAVSLIPCPGPSSRSDSTDSLRRELNKCSVSMPVSKKPNFISFSHKAGSSEKSSLESNAGSCSKPEQVSKRSPSTDKENRAPIEVLAETGCQLKIADCSNCTITIYEKK